MQQLFTGAPDSVKTYGRELLAAGWRFYVVDQTRGQCYAIHKVITIPAWIFRKKTLDYKIYYICHEMAHAYDMCKHNHGHEFMEWFKKICPTEYQHHELGYKPRNARAAGISDITNETLGF